MFCASTVGIWTRIRHGWINLTSLGCCKNNQNFFTHLLTLHQHLAALSSRTFSAHLQFCYSFRSLPRDSQNHFTDTSLNLASFFASPLYTPNFRPSSNGDWRKTSLTLCKILGNVFGVALGSKKRTRMGRRMF